MKKTIYKDEVERRLRKAAEVHSRTDKYHIKVLRAHAQPGALPWVEYDDCMISGWHEEGKLVRITGYTRTQVEACRRAGAKLPALPNTRAARMELIIEFEGMEVVW